MKVSVTVKTRSRTESVQLSDDGHMSVSVHALAVEGKANEAVARAIARHFGVAQSRVTLMKGHSSKHKLFDIS